MWLTKSANTDPGRSRLFFFIGASRSESESSFSPFEVLRESSLELDVGPGGSSPPFFFLFFFDPTLVRILASSRTASCPDWWCPPFFFFLFFF